MRSLVLLALVTLATLPLVAHDRWEAPRRRVVFEAPRCAPSPHWDARGWDERRGERWQHRNQAWRHDCDDERGHLRPLAPPFRSRLVVRFR